MANVTRDSFQDSKNYVEVTFQFRKDVLDSELNELQKIWRSQLYKENVSLFNLDHCIANAFGGHVQSDGVTANTITIKNGFLVAGGYSVYIPNDLVVGGLTTPVGSDRTDDVWLKISETEVNSGVDSSIAVSKLGETTVRKMVTVTVYVDQGGSSPPVDTGAPYLAAGNQQVVLVARMYRQNGVATIGSTQIVDFRSISLQALMAQDRNIMIRGGGISWDGTTLSINSLVVRIAGTQINWNLSGAPALSVTPTDGQAVGWLGTTAANRLRRDAGTSPGSTIGQSATPNGVNDNIATLATFATLTSPIGQFAPNVLIVAVRDGTQIILRDGTVMNPGDYIHQWGDSGGTQSSGETNFAPLKVYRDYKGKGRSTVDHLGYRGGQITEWNEDWRATGSNNTTGTANLPPGWASTVANNAQLVMTDPTSVFRHRHVEVSGPGAAGVFTGLWAPYYLDYLDNDAAMVLETMIMPNAVLATEIFEMGILFDHAGAKDYMVCFRLAYATSTQYQCRTKGTGTSDTPSGIVAANGTIIRTRLEVLGSNESQQGAGTFTARYWINGSVVATKTFTSPGADKVAPYIFFSTSTSGTAAGPIKVGALRLRFNHLLTPDQL